MKKASWVLLALVGVLTIFGGLASLTLAYSGRTDPLAAGATVEGVSAGNPELATALRARRATAAAYAVAFGTLFLAVVLGPYRGGDRWSWWALLTASAVLAVLAVLRIPMLGTRRGTAAAALQLAVVVVALLLDVRRVRAPLPPAP